MYVMEWAVREIHLAPNLTTKKNAVSKPLSYLTLSYLFPHQQQKKEENCQNHVAVDAHQRKERLRHVDLLVFRLIAHTRKLSSDRHQLLHLALHKFRLCQRGRH